MKVNKRSIDNYRKAVDEQAELAKAYVEKALDAYFAANPQSTTADGRAFAIDLLKAALPNFTENAETLAADFFEEMMEAQGIDATSKLYDPIDYDTVEEKVRYFAGELNEGNEEEFVKQVVDATRYFVKRSAYDNMVNNCRDNNVRYARVPSGFETCAFCFMLASRGFVYHSEAKALGEHGYHQNCSCTVVPGSRIDGESRVKIDGYDPETMYQNWLSCADAIGGRRQIRKEWLALPEAERGEWVERHGSPSKAFARFEQDRIMQEVRTRDWHWLYTGEAPKPKYESERAKRELKQHEKETRDILAENGFVQYVLERSNEPYVKTADCLLGAGRRRADWKSPRGASFNTIDQIMRDAGKKADIAVVDLQDGRSVMSLDDAIKHFHACGRRRGIKEAIFVNYDRTIHRIKI